MQRIKYLIGLILCILLAIPTDIGQAQTGCVRGGYARGEISIGTAVEGFVTSSAGDSWTFLGQAGDSVQINMVGENGYDTLLELFDPSCHSISLDDDGGEQLNARIRTVLPYDGVYSINARGFGARLGGYDLSLDEDVVSETGTINEASDVGEIICGDTVTNFTATGFGDQYTFSASAGDVVSFQMTGQNGYDTFLELYNPHRGLIASDDDSGGSLNARLQLTLTESGTYSLIARGYAGMLGSYSLEMRCGSEAGTIARLPHNAYDKGAITCGQTVNSATISPAGDQYLFAATANQSVTITLNGAAGFDPYLELFGPDHIRIGLNDDGGGGLNARLQQTLTLAGNYTIIARGYTGRTGHYYLSMQCSGMGTDIGSTINGAVNMGELFCSQPESYRTSNASGDQYSLQGEAGAIMTLELTGTDGFEPLLELYDEDRALIGVGEQLERNSAIILETRLPSTGTFFAIIRGNEAELGAYEVALTCGAGISGTQTPLQACEGTSGRGFFMGEIAFGQVVNSFTIHSAGDAYLFTRNKGRIDNDQYEWGKRL